MHIFLDQKLNLATFGRRVGSVYLQERSDIVTKAQILEHIKGNLEKYMILFFVSQNYFFTNRSTQNLVFNTKNIGLRPLVRTG